ncbi:glycoside hydrolase family 15 protein [Pseudomonas floridensis]|uniref:glycoside hydrolase family 15 protein n=1 Tax=Pseudomonas floridensis TaxID=1958950 RepID=UPI003CC5CD30
MLAEQYDPQAGRMLGNFPQAFSHIGIINTALNLHRTVCPASKPTSLHRSHNRPNNAAASSALPSRT